VNAVTKDVVTKEQEQSLATVKRYMWWTGGASLIPVPWLDFAAVSGIELKMLADLSRIYDIPFDRSRGKAAIASLIGFVLPHALAYGAIGSALKAVPIVGALAGAPAMAAFTATYTWAVGNVFIQHFESGGTFLDFDPEKVREHFREHFQEGRGKGPSPKPA
jgi:uncharacterized protein (DUF697 family)